MNIRIKMNQPADCSPCAHRGLTLKGIDLKRSRERYTCNAFSKPVVRTLKTSVSNWLVPDHHATETNPSAPSDTGN